MFWCAKQLRSVQYSLGQQERSACCFVGGKCNDLLRLLQTRRGGVWTSEVPSFVTRGVWNTVTVISDTSWTDGTPDPTLAQLLASNKRSWLSSMFPTAQQAKRSWSWCSKLFCTLLNCFVHQNTKFRKLYSQIPRFWQDGTKCTISGWKLVSRTLKMPSI